MKTFSRQIILTMMALLTVVACGKKKGDSAPPPVVTTCAPGQVLPTGQICANGQIVPVPTGSGNLLNNLQMQSSYMQGVLGLTATSGMNMGNVNPETMVYYYAGPITVNGTIQVLNQSLCGAPVGSYAVSGTGMIQYGVIGGLTLNVSGPASMQLMIYKAVVTNPQGLSLNSPGNRFGILQSALTVNGMPCGMVTTY